MTTYHVSAQASPNPGVQTAVLPPAPMWTFVASDTGKPIVYEVGTSLNVGGGTSPVMVLGRPAALGVSPRDIVPAVCEEPDAPAALSYMALDWVASPSPPVQVFRRQSIKQTTPAQGVLWSFPRGLAIPQGGQLGLFNAQAGSSGNILDAWVAFDE